MRVILLLAIWISCIGFAFSQDKLEIIQGKINLNDFEGNNQTVFLSKNKQGQAKLKQKETFIEADSIKHFTNRNYAEAFGKVFINQADSVEIYSDKANYFGNERRTELIGEVALTKDVYTLQTEELDYNLNTRVATYTTGGELSDTTSNLTSIYGKYNLNTEIAEFKDSVVLITPDRKIETQKLIYHMKDKWAYFSGRTVITEKDRVLVTNKGKYNTETGEAEIDGSPIIEDEKTKFAARQITKKGDYSKAVGDVYFYDKEKNVELRANEAEQLSKEHVIARGNVRYIEHDKNAILIAQEAERLGENQIRAKGNVHYTNETDQVELKAQEVEQRGEDQFYAKGKVWLKDDKNQLIVKTDEAEQFNKDQIRLTKNVDITSFKDSLNLTSGFALIHKTDKDFFARENVRLKRLNQNTELLTDTLQFSDKKGYGIATGRPFIETEQEGDKIFMIAKQLEAIRQNDIDSTYNFIANKNFKLFKSDIQAIADSAYVNNVDSVITLTKRPIIWADSIQMSADTIRIHLKNQEVERVEFRQNCFFINLEEGKLYNQVKGKKMDAFLKNREIDSLFVDGNAETIFFVKDEKQAYVGVDEMKSGQISVDFENGKMKEVHWLKQQEGTTYPFQEIDPQSKRLSGFSWQDYKKPTGKEFLLIASGRKEGQTPQPTPEAIEEETATDKNRGKIVLSNKKKKNPEQNEKENQKRKKRKGKQPQRNQSPNSLPIGGIPGELKKSND